MEGLLLVGDLYLDRFTDGGGSTGYLGPLNGVKLGITHPDPDVIERVSKMKDTFGQALDVVTMPKSAELTIAIDDQPSEILSLAMLGSVASLNQGAGTLVDAPVTLVPGRWVSLGFRNLVAAGFSVATAAVPATPLVLGTDYEVNYADGLIRAIPGGAIAAETECLVDGDYNAVTGQKITGGARPTARCRVLLSGKNMANGKTCRIEIDEAILSPAGELDLLSGEFITTELTGKMRTLAGKNGPYTFEEVA